MFEFFVIFMEVIAFASLIMFAGTLSSKYYEDKGPIKFIEITKWVTVAMLAIMLFPSGVHVRFEWAHIVFHLTMIAMSYVGWKKFKTMRFKYPEQFKDARSLLYTSIMLEVAGATLFTWYII